MAFLVREPKGGKTYGGAAADEGSDAGVILGGGSAVKVLEVDVADGHVGLEAMVLVHQISCLFT